MAFLQILLLSFIQGLTEFLPISSSAHLILFSSFFNSNIQSLNFDVSVHLGTLFAALVYFKEYQLPLKTQSRRQEASNKSDYSNITNTSFRLLCKRFG